MISLAEALPLEINRVRTLQDIYRTLLGQPGVMIEPAIAIMDEAITEGVLALGSGDVVRMMRAHLRLQDFGE